MFSSPPSTPSCVYTVLDILTSTWCSVQWEVVYNTAVESVNSGARLPGCDSSSTTWKSRIKYLMSPCLKFFTSGYARRIKWIDAYKVLRIDLLSVNWRHYSLIIFFFSRYIIPEPQLFSSGWVLGQLSKCIDSVSSGFCAGEQCRLWAWGPSTVPGLCSHQLLIECLHCAEFCSGCLRDRWKNWQDLCLVELIF